MPENCSFTYWITLKKEINIDTCICIYLKNSKHCYDSMGNCMIWCQRLPELNNSPNFFFQTDVNAIQRKEIYNIKMIYFLFSFKMHIHLVKFVIVTCEEKRWHGRPVPTGHPTHGLGPSRVTQWKRKTEVPRLLPGYAPATAAVTRLVTGCPSLSARSQILMMKHAHCWTCQAMSKSSSSSQLTRAGTGSWTSDTKAHHRASMTLCS